MRANQTSDGPNERASGRALWRIGALLLAVAASACGGGGTTGTDDSASSGAGAGSIAGASGSTGGSAGVSGGAGGGAGAPGTAAGVASLEVVPAFATVTVGGMAQYSVVARDGAGLVVASPSVTWVAATPAIGTITAAGTATGTSRGQTGITARGSGVTSSPAVLNVVDTTVVDGGGACDGVAGVPEWQVALAYVYLDDVLAPAPVELFAEHDVSVAATLTPAGTVGGRVQWSGSLVPANLLTNVSGAVQLFEHSSDVQSDPNIDLSARGIGAPLATDGVAGFTLTIDLSTCTYRFTVAPSVSVTITKTEHAITTLPEPEEGVRTYTQVLPLGLLQKGSAPLGDWRARLFGKVQKSMGRRRSATVGALATRALSTPS